jgi:hypothetical protein
MEQSPADPAGRVPVVQDSPVRRTCADEFCCVLVRLKLVLCEKPFRLAETMAAWLVAIVPAVAVNFTLCVPRANFADTGTVRRALLLVNRILAPLSDTAETVAVQVADEPEVRVVAEQESEETYTETARPTLAILEAPL